MHSTYNIKTYKIQTKYFCTLISQQGQICTQSLGAGYGSCMKQGQVGVHVLKIMFRTKTKQYSESTIYGLSSLDSFIFKFKTEIGIESTNELINICLFIQFTQM